MSQYGIIATAFHGSAIDRDNAALYRLRAVGRLADRGPDFRLESRAKEAKCDES
jgi:hypothetical protein